MQNFDYLIVGGGIAGTTAAETIRKNDSVGTIAIVSDEPHRLYSRIMLSKPNFFLEKVPFDQIWLKDEVWYSANGIKPLFGKKAVKLEPQSKSVSLNDGADIGYGKLLLAIGSCARRWDIPGADKRAVFYLRTLDDAKEIMAAAKSSKSAAAIGGGFISFEMCDLLRMAGLDVSLILRESYYWEPILDETSGRMIEEALKNGGVKIFYNSEAAEVIGGEMVEGLVLKDGSRVDCDIVIAGIGVVCPLDWLRNAGIVLNRGIIANEYLEANLSDIWTAGDVAEFNDLVLGEQVQLGNWANAQMQGKTAGLNMAGKKEPFKFVSSYTTQRFGISIAFVGDVRPGPDRSVISRGSKELNSYCRLLVKGGEVIGATLINKPSEVSAVSKLIERDVKVAGLETKLADPNFDLKSVFQ